MLRLLRQRAGPLVIGLVLVFAAAAPSHAGHTAGPAMLTLEFGVTGTLIPVIESGDVHDGVEFQGIPDGIGLAPGPSANTMWVFVNHEESHVPFTSGGVTTADVQDASVSRLLISTAASTLGQVLSAEVALPASDGFLRFCSASMAGPAQGLSGYTFFTNEEDNALVPVPPGAPYQPDPAVAPDRQAGYSVVLDVESGKYDVVEGMGRHNHENTVLVPGGWDEFAILSTDDLFLPPGSQLYMYLAGTEKDIWKDKGTLWGFRVTATQGGPVDPDDPFNGANDYLDIEVGDNWQGEFIKVPKQIARGQTKLLPQDALETWSNDNNVFQFIRLEDIAYDKNDPQTVYIADTGASRIIPDTATGRMQRPSTVPAPFPSAGLAPNGRIFKFVFDEDDPREVDSFSILLNADPPTNGPFGDPATAMKAPDNMDTSLNSLMVQEDSGTTPNSRVWRYDFSGTWTVVAHVNKTAWESSGIVDASSFIGPGWWVLDVQAHGSADYVQSTVVDGVTIKQEGGQLLLMNIAGT